MGSEGRSLFIARPSFAPPPPKNDGPRVNHEIHAREIRVIDYDGAMLGVMTVRDAMRRAEEVGLDLVEISPTAVPPVCKVLDYGKFKYESQKKAAAARKKQRVIEVKEIKMRPGIDTHDFDVKMRQIKNFLTEGDKVKVTMRFRGREMVHQEIGMQVLDKVKADVNEVAKVEQTPSLEGRQMSMVIAPK